jgi:hypothetical protein
MALIPWGISLIILVLIALVHWLTIQNRQTSIEEWFALLLFWVMASWFAIFSSSLSCTYVTLGDHDEINFTWLFPFRRVCKTFSSTTIAEPVLSETVDSDGDSHFKAYLNLPDGSEFILVDSIVRDGDKNFSLKHKLRCELAIKKFKDLSL